MKILIIGGTFCPPHLAHLAIVEAVQQHFAFDQVFFVPCKAPVIDKVAEASIKHRLAMLKLAIQSHPNYKIDLCEVNRKTPSYMVDTLKDFRQRFGETASITLLLGMDSFIQLPRWDRFEDILNLSHILIVNRAGIKPDYPNPLQTLLKKHISTPLKNICTKPYGVIQQYDAGYYPMSSTQIRKAIQEGLNTDHLIDSKIRAYIDKHRLFDH